MSRCQSLVSHSPGCPEIGRLFQPGVGSGGGFESVGVRISHYNSQYLGLDELAGVQAHLEPKGE